ncbi:hypothetical protein BDN72DRAFT_964931 [Pluteus cervinus]|uniref:Uncharacterized protein n=1 Tax=Pluteus cervinus TaxID=181527 RepID=A0ACD3A892_9AGAR|nr:hypothetical protein BDN72DRAFT_964931 [Pluteus cervinus]
MEGTASATFPFEFPPELERSIFEIAALSDPKTAVFLLSVCRTIHEWIGTITYRTLTHVLLPIGKKYPDLAWYQRHGKFIRHILFSGSDDIVPFLACCPHLENIAIWGQESPADMDGVLDVVTGLKSQSTTLLTTLSLSLDWLFADAYNTATIQSGAHLLHDGDSESQTPLPFQFTPTFGQYPLLRHITHLELLDPCQSWATYKGLASMPSLTHLCIARESATIFTIGALKECRYLKALILMETFTPSDTERGGTCRLLNQARVEEDLRDLEGDMKSLGAERIVVMGVIYTEDWTNGANGSKSMWTLADEVIAGR